MQLVGRELAGAPDSDLVWVKRRLRKLQRALQRDGLRLSRGTIRRILLDYNIRPKANVKHLMPRPPPARDRQFRYIQTVRKRFDTAGWPSISVDTKKKELIGLLILGEPPALPGRLPVFDIYRVVHVTPQREPLKAHEARSTWTIVGS